MNHASLCRSEQDGSERAARIRQLNDSLRRDGVGGRVNITLGITALPASARAEILDAVVRFDAFTAANDPFDEHDFGIVRAGGTLACFKLDYYDTSLTEHSPDPADAGVTARVLTVMLGDEV